MPARPDWTRFLVSFPLPSNAMRSSFHPDTQSISSHFTTCIQYRPHSYGDPDPASFIDAFYDIISVLRYLAINCDCTARV